MRVTLTTKFGPVGISLSRELRRNVPMVFLHPVEGAGRWVNLTVDGEAVLVAGSMTRELNGWAAKSSEGIRVKPGAGSAPPDAADQISEEIAALLEDEIPETSDAHEEQRMTWVRQRIERCHLEIAQLEERRLVVEGQIEYWESELEPPPGPPETPEPPDLPE
jgi:hypothetical protein